jgi:hypothetical protein
MLDQRERIQDCRRQLKKLAREHKPIQSQREAVGLVTACVLWTCLGDAAHYTARRWA